MNKKYELVDDQTTTIDIDNGDGTTTPKTLKKIRALKDFADVNTGDLGGYVETEGNLSQRGNCWIYSGKVYGTGRVQENATVYWGSTTIPDNVIIEGFSRVEMSINGNVGVGGNAYIANGPKINGTDPNRKIWIYDNAKVYGWARIEGYGSIFNNAHVYGICRLTNKYKICGNAHVHGHAELQSDLDDEIQIIDNAQVYGSTLLSGGCRVSENAQVFGGARIRDNSQIFGNAKVHGYARIHDDARIYGYAEVRDDASIGDRARVYDNAKIYGWCDVHGSARVFGDAQVHDEAVIKDNARVYENAIVRNKAVVMKDGIAHNDDILNDRELRR